MNKVAFYQGIINELEKRSDVPATTLQEPKKKEFYQRPGFWAGMGGLGLAGLGAYGMMHGQKPNIPSQIKPVTSALSTPEPEFQPTAAGQVSNAANVGQLGLFGGSLVGAIPKIQNVPGLNKIPFNKLTGPGNVLGSIGMVADSLDRNNDSPLSAKMIEGGAGAVDGIGTMLTSKALQPAATRLAPTLTNVATKAMGAGARFGTLPLTGAYMAGQLGQTAMAHGTASAEDHFDHVDQTAKYLSDSTDKIKNNARYTPDYDKGMQNLYSLYNDPAKQKFINRVTEPKFFDRLGYGQYYHMPKWMGGKGYDSGPNTAPVQHALDTTKSRFETEMNESGTGTTLMRNNLDEMLAKNLASSAGRANNIVSQ